MNSNTSSGKSKSSQKPSQLSGKANHIPVCGPIERSDSHADHTATCSVGDTVSSTEMKAICLPDSISLNNHQDGPCPAASTGFNENGVAQGVAQSHTTQADEIEVPGPMHLAEAGGNGQAPIKDESFLTPNPGPFGEDTVFGSPAQAASTEKIVLKNLDPVGARDRALTVHRARFRYLTDRQQLLIHDGSRYGDFPRIAERLVLEVLDNLHREFGPNKKTRHRGWPGNLSGRRAELPRQAPHVWDDTPAPGPYILKCCLGMIYKEV